MTTPTDLDKLGRIIWYIELPLTTLSVWVASMLKPRPGGREYWWSIAKDNHAIRWGKK